MIHFCGQGNNLLITCIGIYPATVSNTILERSVESTYDFRDIRVCLFYPTQFFKLHIKTEIGVSRLGKVLEEDCKEAIVVVGVLIFTLSDNLLPQVRHLRGQFTNVVATRLEGQFLQAILQILYVHNKIGLHRADCEIENYKPAKDTPICHFSSVTEGLLLC